MCGIQRRLIVYGGEVYGGDVLPSPERACPDTEGGGVGLGGKSDIMPCNLFLRFSEPGKRRERERERHKTSSHAERRRRDGEASRWTDERQTNVDRGKKLDFIL